MTVVWTTNATKYAKAAKKEYSFFAAFDILEGVPSWHSERSGLPMPGLILKQAGHERVVTQG